MGSLATLITNGFRSLGVRVGRLEEQVRELTGRTSVELNQRLDRQLAMSLSAVPLVSGIGPGAIKGLENLTVGSFLALDLAGLESRNSKLRLVRGNSTTLTLRKLIRSVLKMMGFDSIKKALDKIPSDKVPLLAKLDDLGVEVERP